MTQKWPGVKQNKRQETTENCEWQLQGVASTAEKSHSIQEVVSSNYTPSSGFHFLLGEKETSFCGIALSTTLQLPLHIRQLMIKSTQHSTVKRSLPFPGNKFKYGKKFLFRWLRWSFSTETWGKIFEYLGVEVWNDAGVWCEARAWRPL